ncbi:MAG: efflux RND transporter periplasmic adaptor subunit [Acidobacteria bacterium]|nr:efflux RND transporter periplasmic adaptor subunit [Acidobacteriota bacterium]
MKRTLAMIALIVTAFTGGWYASRQGAPTAQAPQRKVLHYIDPMHPWYKSDKPGIAPDCNMALVPVYEDDAAARQARQPDNRKVLYYYDPQRPAYRSNNPGLNPETGDDLVPMYENDPESFSPGTIQISTEKQQLIGVKTGVAEIASGSRTLRAVGKVTIDERRVHHVHSRTEGWIETVHADYVGRPVKHGELLFTLYSPELFASQQEFLLALRARETMQRSSREEDRRQMDSLVAAARHRLEQWELTPQQIRELEQSRKPVREIPFYSPHAGLITARNAFPHQMAKPDMELYTIVDYSRVWVIADLYEFEAPSVQPGMTGTITSSYTPGRTMPARVTFVQPEVDPMTRTVKVRLELDNPGLALKPDMFVDVEFRLARPAQVMVPSSAVLDSGLRKRVFIDRGDGYFEPREVETGDTSGDRIAIVKGLRAGDRIVVSGNFLIDSESQLKSGGQRAAPPEPVEHRHD